MQRKPFILKTIMAVAACKAVRAFLRRSGRGGGTALPGKVARKFSKQVLETTSEGMDIIVVTGTNGKTTTANMLISPARISSPESRRSSHVQRIFSAGRRKSALSLSAMKALSSR